MKILLFKLEKQVGRALSLWKTDCNVIVLGSFFLYRFRAAVLNISSLGLVLYRCCLVFIVA